jgi:hypothetical protein
MNRFTFVAALLAISALPASAFDVTGCGQSIPNREHAVLVADLVCPPGTTAVRLHDGSLDLGGHSITAPQGWAVWCSGSCTVTNGGIEGGQSGIYLQRGARLVGQNLAITGSQVGIQAEDWNNGVNGSKALLTNVVITGSDLAAVQAGRVLAENVDIHDNSGHGIFVPWSGVLKSRGLTVKNNAYSAGCHDYGCVGISAGRIAGRDLVVTDNQGLGINAISAKLRVATVTGNSRAGAAKDLVIAQRPNLRDVECWRSAGWGSNSTVPWGVCLLDDDTL